MIFFVPRGVFFYSLFSVRKWKCDRFFRGKVDKFRRNECERCLTRGNRCYVRLCCCVASFLVGAATVIIGLMAAAATTVMKEMKKKDAVPSEMSIRQRWWWVVRHRPSALDDPVSFREKIPRNISEDFRCDAVVAAAGVRAVRSLLTGWQPVILGSRAKITPPDPSSSMSRSVPVPWNRRRGPRSTLKADEFWPWSRDSRRRKTTKKKSSSSSSVSNQTIYSK